MNGRPLSHAEMKALRLLHAGSDIDGAYIAAFPIAGRWKPETVKAKAEELVKSAEGKEFLNSLGELTSDDLMEALDAGYSTQKRIKKAALKKKAKPKAKPNPVGRPTSYKPEYVKKLIDYFNIKPGKMVKDQYVACDMPTLAGFAVSIGVHRDTIHEWSKGYPDFSDAVKRAKASQEHIVFVNGMNKSYSSPIVVLFAKNNLGYKDDRNLAVTGPAGGPVQTITREMTAEEAGRIYREEVKSG